MGFSLGDLDNTTMAGTTSSLLDLLRTWLLMPGQLLNIIVGLEIFFQYQLLILVHLDELYNKYYLCMFGKPGLGLVCYIHNNTAVCDPRCEEDTLRDKLNLLMTKEKNFSFTLKFSNTGLPSMT